MTGTELVTGRIVDRNGPWMAERLAESGVDVSYELVVGDRPEEIVRSLGFLVGQGVDLVVTSGGLGPTADDLTVAAVSEFASRRMTHSSELESRIKSIVESFPGSRKLDANATAEAARKQATIPEDALVLGFAGTAPGLVVEIDNLPIVLLPGPPAELQSLWPRAVSSPGVARVLGLRTRDERRVLRLFGLPESEIAATLRRIGSEVDLSGHEIVTCLRDGELEVVVGSAPGAGEEGQRILDGIRRAHRERVFSDGETIDELVAEALAGRRLAVAESCTGGMLAARITDRPGASTYFAGGAVAYSNESKHVMLGVERNVIESCGAVSSEVAQAMAQGAKSRFAAEVAVAVTGVAGPTGGTAGSPLGTVWFAVDCDGKSVVARRVRLAGDRGQVRRRATTVALHLLRRVLVA